MYKAVSRSENIKLKGERVDYKKRGETQTRHTGGWRENKVVLTSIEQIYNKLKNIRVLFTMFGFVPAQFNSC
jgi:hypothetical protein